MAGITLEEDEIEAHRFAELDEALDLLAGPLRRRVARSIDRAGCVYLEEGRPVKR